MVVVVFFSVVVVVVVVMMKVGCVGFEFVWFFFVVGDVGRKCVGVGVWFVGKCSF